MYDDDIGYFVVCFQDILSGEWNCFILVPLLFFSCVHQFRLIVLNVVNQIITYHINQWYLVVHCVESHVLGGPCRVEA